jgi:hypothetical protein
VKLLIGAIVATWALLVVLGAARAEGDGLPLPGGTEGLDTTRAGVLSADGTERFIAIPAGDRTMLLRANARTGVIRDTQWLPGRYVVPAVSLDGDTSGLSEDGRTLVLIAPRPAFPRRVTSLLVVNPTSLRATREIPLKGDFSFDAISPDGKTVYIVEYPDPRDRNDYRLRRLVLPQGRLLSGSLLPENDPGEEMRGMPMSRATGPGGRWEYTLYDGGATYPGREVGEPFVHALDTVGERTLCIDLDWITPSAVGRMDLRMSAGGDEVEVVDPRFGVVGRIDTASGEAREVSEPFAAAPAGEEGGGGAGGAIKLVGAALLLSGAGLLAFGIRRRARPGAVGEAGA